MLNYTKNQSEKMDEINTLIKKSPYFAEIRCFGRSCKLIVTWPHWKPKPNGDSHNAVVKVLRDAGLKTRTCDKRGDIHIV
jgi:hypothetical protein